MLNDLLSFFSELESSGLSRFIYGFITWVVIFSGWFVVNRQNNLRERRKELRGQIDDVKDFVEKIIEKSVEFHTSEFNSDDMSSLTIDFKRLNRSVARLGVPHNEKRSLSFHVREFKKAVTLDNFGAGAFRVQDKRSLLVAKIIISADNLLDDVERCFRYCFK